MAFLIGGANSLTAGYDIDNSLRLDSGSSAYLYRDQVDPTSEGQIYTISVWNKICIPNGTGQNAMLLEGGDTDGSGATVDETFFMHNVAGTLFFQDALNDSTVLGKQTASLQRDVSAWYHFMLSVDTTQGTDTNRLKVYVNGENVSANMTGGWPAEDVIHQLNQEFSDSSNQNTHNIGKQTRGSNYSDMYIADFAFVDGLQLAPSNFGEVDEDSGIWKPKAPSVSAWGDNGFFLEFKETGTGTAGTTTIGADTSGNNNHFTTSGIASTDITTDTPTNNFCTLSSIGPGLTTSSASVANESLSVGNTGLTGYDGSSTVESTMAVANGKWYVEYKLTDVQNAQMGICGGINRTDDYLGNSAHAYGYISSNATAGDTGIYNNNSLINIFRDGVQTDGEIHMLAFDLDNNKLWIGQNGTWKNSSDPTDSSGGGGQAISAATSTKAQHYSVAFRNGSADGATSYINFGCPAYANASSQSDANGYGDFEFAPPTGYYALCTKNIAEYG